MTESIKEELVAEAVCGECRADVRSGSLYCYNCGGKIGEPNSSIPSASQLKRSGALSSASKIRSIDRMAGSRNKTYGASAERRSGRQSRLAIKPAEFEWQNSDGPGYWLLLIALVVAGFVLLIVGIALYLH